MNRFLAGALLTFALVGPAAAANAAPTTPSAQPLAKTQVASAQINYTAECKALGEQWINTSKTHASNPHFATAKADAARGRRNCASTNTAMHKMGIGQYETALKLLGVTPTL